MKSPAAISQGLVLLGAHPRGALLEHAILVAHSQLALAPTGDEPAGMRVAAAEEMHALERRLTEDKDKAVATVKMDLVEAEEAVKALRAQITTLEDALASTPR